MEQAHLPVRAADTQAIIAHARDHPELSLGVAAFSAAQRRAILDHLEVLRRTLPPAVCDGIVASSSAAEASEASASPSSPKAPSSGACSTSGATGLPQRGVGAIVNRRG